MRFSYLAILAFIVFLLILPIISIGSDFLIALPIVIGIWFFLYLRNQNED